MGKAKLTLALANTMKGNFLTSEEILTGLATFWDLDTINMDHIDFKMSENISTYNLIRTINNFMLKNYENLRQDLCESAIFAQNTGLEYHKNLFKTMLGKLICDSKQAKHALEIYNTQINYFADKKLAFGALLCWYFISEATLIMESPKKSIEILSQALDIAKNPKINNLFFITLLQIQLAKANIVISDYQEAKIHLDSALAIAKKYSMNDITSKIYLEYGKYYTEIGTIASQNQTEYLKGAMKMYDKALEIVIKTTKSIYMKEIISANKEQISKYCQDNGFNI